MNDDSDEIVLKTIKDRLAGACCNTCKRCGYIIDQYVCMHEKNYSDYRGVTLGYYCVLYEGIPGHDRR